MSWSLPFSDLLWWQTDLHSWIYFSSTWKTRSCQQGEEFIFLEDHLITKMAASVYQVKLGRWKFLCVRFCLFGSKIKQIFFLFRLWTDCLRSLTTFCIVVECLLNNTMSFHPIIFVMRTPRLLDLILNDISHDI